MKLGLWAVKVSKIVQNAAVIAVTIYLHVFLHISILSIQITVKDSYAHKKVTTNENLSAECARGNSSNRNA